MDGMIRGHDGVSGDAERPVLPLQPAHLHGCVGRVRSGSMKRVKSWSDGSTVAWAAWAPTMPGPTIGTSPAALRKLAVFPFSRAASGAVPKVR